MGSVGERSAIPGDSSDESGLDSSALSIDLFLPHGHLTPVLSFDFFHFLTSSEKRNSIEHNLIPSAPALDTCSCFDQSCKVELCLCPAKKGWEDISVTFEMKSFFRRKTHLQFYFMTVPRN